jgi:hypothetical protein
VTAWISWSKAKRTKRQRKGFSKVTQRVKVFTQQNSY